MNKSASAISRVALFCMLLCPASAFSQTFELNGLELGKPATREQIKSTIGLSCTPHCESGRGCYVSCGAGTTLIAGVNALTMVGLDAEHTVQAISASFETVNFNVISSALTAKYGSPIRVDYSMIITADGKQFDQTVDIWQNEAGDEVKLSRYLGDDVRFGSIVLRTRTQIYRTTAMGVEQRKEN